MVCPRHLSRGIWPCGRSRAARPAVTPGSDRQCVNCFERILQPHLPGGTALDLAARRLRNATGANEHDRVERDLVLVCDRLADAGDNLLDLDVATMDAFHLLDQDHLFLVVSSE